MILPSSCAHHPRQRLLFQVHNKGGDPSEKRQRKEIAEARKHLRAWRSSR
jgi:ribosomal protein S21